MGADTFNRAAVFATLRLRPVAVAGAEAVGPQPIMFLSEGTPDLAAALSYKGPDR